MAEDEKIEDAKKRKKGKKAIETQKGEANPNRHQSIPGITSKIYPYAPALITPGSPEATTN